MRPSFKLIRVSRGKERPFPRDTTIIVDFLFIFSTICNVSDACGHTTMTYTCVWICLRVNVRAKSAGPVRRMSRRIGRGCLIGPKRDQPDRALPTSLDPPNEHIIIITRCAIAWRVIASVSHILCLGVFGPVVIVSKGAFQSGVEAFGVGALRDKILRSFCHLEECRGRGLQGC